MAPRLARRRRGAKAEAQAPNLTVITKTATSAPSDTDLLRLALADRDTALDRRQVRRARRGPPRATPRSF
jgi:hypothetical protein